MVVEIRKQDYGASTFMAIHSNSCSYLKHIFLGGLGGWHIWSQSLARFSLDSRWLIEVTKMYFRARRLWFWSLKVSRCGSELLERRKVVLLRCGRPWATAAPVRAHETTLPVIRSSTMQGLRWKHHHPRTNTYPQCHTYTHTHTHIYTHTRRHICTVSLKQGRTLSRTHWKNNVW